MMRAGASLTENRFFNNCGGKLFAKTGPILLDSNILAVEDSPAILNLIRMSLEDAGYLCVCAEDGVQAADLLEERQFDLVLLDVMLPGIDGFNLKMNVSILSLMRQCTDYALRYSHNSDRWFGPVLAKHFFE